MDHYKIAKESMSQLKQFLTKDLHVDLPLWQHNPNNSITISLERLNVCSARELVREIIVKIFGKSSFWMLEYGKTSGETFKKLGLLASPSDVLTLPYHTELLDPEWFEYEYDAISCLYTNLDKVNLNTYIDYCFRLDYLSNSIYIVSLVQKCAIAVYDRSVMDIATLDHIMLKELREKYTEYLRWDYC